MRKLFWLLLLILLVPSSASGQGPVPFPGPPAPDPPTVPNCPMQLMGIANGVHYWVTAVCPLTPDGPTGFGQSMTSVPTGCKELDPTQCCSPVLLLSGDSPGKSIRKTGQFELQACAMPGSTPAELEDKLKEILKESKKLEKYLQKLTKPGNTEISPERKNRIEIWKLYLGNLITYLEDSHASADSTAVKVQNYCTDVISVFRMHETAWSTATLKPTNGRASAVKDDLLDVQLSADDVIFVPEAGVTHNAGSDKVWEVTVKDLPGAASRTVYFKTFTYYRTSEGPLSAAQIGVQVTDPGTSTPKKAKFKDRNSFGHKLASNDDSQLFLVSSFDDLSVAVDP